MTTLPDNPKKKIFIVDDHPLVREWLAHLLNRQADLEVCGEAGSASEGIKLIAETKPNIAIVDISMKGDSGIELIKAMRALCPEVSVIVLSVHDKTLYGKRALRAGARGYVLKQEASENVMHAIRAVLDGKLYFSEKVTAPAGDAEARHPTTRLPGSSSLVELLSDREFEVFQLIGRGRNTRQIAEEMQVSFKTVQSFCARIKEKLHLTNAIELLREATLWVDGHSPK